MGLSDMIGDLTDWFDAYTGKFLPAENISLKIDHTHRVCRISTELATDLALEQKSRDLCFLCALLHDVGRFEQYSRYGTFSDARSENHAALSVRLIKEWDLLSGLSEHERTCVLDSIAVHNRALIPAGLSPDALLQARVLRDADKLDIFHILADYYTGSEHNSALQLENEESPGISPEVHEAIMASRIVLSEHVRNLNDFKFLQLAWVFDLNYPFTAEKILEEGYVKTIIGTIIDQELDPGLFGIIERSLRSQTRHAAGARRSI